MSVRVMHVFGRMARGGAELRTIEIMRRIDRAQVGQEFATLSGLPGELDAEIAALGGAVHPCRLDAGFVPRFVRLLRDRRPDVVHSHVFLTSGLILAVAMAAGVPRRIAHFRSTSDGQTTTWRRRAYRASMRGLIDRCATDILGVSAGSLHDGWSPRWADDARCRVIYNGVDPDRVPAGDNAASIRRELGLALDARVIVQVGRFEPPKNQPLAADILAQLPEAHLAFVGRSGSTEAETRRRLDAHGIAARAHFVGERTDVGRWLAGADVSLLTSVLEGLPGAALESLACGTPMVASDLPGVREIASALPGVTAVALTEPPARWAQTVREVIDHKPDPAALRARLATSAFTLDAAVAQHVAVWQRA